MEKRYRNQIRTEASSDIMRKRKRFPKARTQTKPKPREADKAGCVAVPTPRVVAESPCRATDGH